MPNKTKSYQEVEAEKKAVSSWRPAVGDILYRDIPDPFYVPTERENGYRYNKPQVSVGYKVTKVTATRFTTEDGNAYVLEGPHTSYYNRNVTTVEVDGESKFIWQANAYGRYASGHVYREPQRETVYLKSDLDAKINADREAKRDAATKARRAKVDEFGLRATLADILSDRTHRYDRRSELRLLREVLTEEEKEGLTDALIEAAFDLGDRIYEAARRFESIANEANRGLIDLKRGDN